MAEQNVRNLATFKAYEQIGEGRIAS